jgi:signal transduction histidine kinase
MDSKALAGNCAVVALSVGAALAVAWLVPPLEEAPSPPFLAAVAVCAWRGGLVAGLAATFFSAAALDFFFLPPVYSFGVGLADGVRLGVFVLVALVVSSLHASRRHYEKALRRQDRRRAEVLAVVAHELRNFLAPATNALHLLREVGSNGPIAISGRDILERQLKNMSRLVDDLLDRVRLDQGKLRLRHERLDLRAVVSHAAEAVRHTAAARGHRLEVCVPELPVYLPGDATRLEQVFVNLLGNSIRYTESGGTVCVELQRTVAEACVCVRDSGRGIQPERLSRIFDLFEQGGGEAERAGLGIGLSLVRDLVRLHGGEVSASSGGPGRGSEFVVRLPLSGHEPADGGDLPPLPAVRLPGP